MARLLDENGKPYEGLDSWSVEKAVPSAFVGTSGDRGDKDTGSPLTIFTVTGDVLVRIIAVCTTTLVGAGKLELGVANNTAKLIAQITDATTLIADEIWNDGTPTEKNAAAFSDVPSSVLIVNGADIIETVSTTDITAGQIYYICLWRPLSSDGKVEAVDPV